MTSQTMTKQTAWSLWNRRQWLLTHTVGLAAMLPRRAAAATGPWQRALATVSAAQRARVTQQAASLDPAIWEALAQRAVEAAQAAGASYAEARLTRLVRHYYKFGGPNFALDEEYMGLGVRALVDGYWGFSASGVVAADEVVRLAQDAVGQAKENAKGIPWTVALGTYPVATGHWATPLTIDPFTVPIEEKLALIFSWKDCIHNVGLEGGGAVDEWNSNWLSFVREERVVATSEGARFTQTVYETGGLCLVKPPRNPLDALGNGNENARQIRAQALGLDLAGAGWEHLLEAQVPEQLYSGKIRQELSRLSVLATGPIQIGKYTLVCDGATMAALTEATLGVATQLDRALGYEANAGGTSWLDDPLGMVGTAQVAAPGVTLTANRSAPKELATVKWDEEGVESEPFTLVKDGVLVDFQTTREQAAWLAPYYQKQGRPVKSHGCAAAESGHYLPLQHMPNLSLEPNPAAIGLQDLIANVSTGILVEQGLVSQLDSQRRTGLLSGSMREIRNGRPGKVIEGGAIFFNTQTLWKSITAVGGAATQATRNTSQYGIWEADSTESIRLYGKGEPTQRTSHSVRAAAATIANQPIIDPTRKA